MQEEWRPVGSQGLYEVSSQGRIRNIVTGRIKEPTRTEAGLLVVNLYDHGRGSATAVHSVVAEAFLGQRKRSDMVCHRDGDQTNCAASNLVYAALGLRVPPDENDLGKNLAGKLTSAQAAEIRRLAHEGEVTKDLAELFGVSAALVSNIKHGKKWKNAEP